MAEVAHIPLSRMSVQVSIADALSMWRGWHLDMPPTGSTGDRALDKRLADAFRELASLPTREDRFAWIERAVWSADDFPAPNRPANRYRETLLRWWFDIRGSE